MRTLIRGGWIVTMDPADREHPGGDLLLAGDRIEAVGDRLPVPPGTEVIDATGMLVLPGLVDTHRHTWQTALRHRGAGWSLAGYLDTLLRGQAPRYRPPDVYAGTLLGALGALDAGITTLVDWAHIEATTAHSDASVAALRDAGIRAVFAHGRPILGPDTPADPGGAEAAGRADLRRVRETLLADDGALVTLAMAAHGPDFTPPETTAADFALARELGVPITAHVGGGRPGTNPRGVRVLHEAGLLGPDLTLVHANGIPEAELRVLADHGVRVSISPQIELTMPGLGAGVAIRRLLAAGIRPGLSTDSETATSGDLFNQMRFALAAHRSGALEETNPGETNANADPEGGGVLAARPVLRLATVDGAATAGLAGRTGALVPGLAADVVLVRGTDLNLAPVSVPADAVVLAAHPGNVDTVLVGGTVVKRGGRLLAGADRARELAAASAAYLLSAEMVTESSR
jgi:cytosine/adenosine deaminase-related metal-dependent hydrolase